MTEITPNIQNINSHYSSNSKTSRPQRVVVSGPTTIPQQHLYNDIDANNRLKALDEEIYQISKNEKNKSFKNFCKVFLSIVVAILGVIGIRELVKFFK